MADSLIDPSGQSGGSLRAPEITFLHKEKPGEKNLIQALIELKAQKDTLTENLREKYPDGRFFTGKLEDRKSSPGYRRLELRIEDGGNSDLSIQFADPNKGHTDFKNHIVCEIYTLGEETHISINLTKNVLDPHTDITKGFVLHLKPDTETLDKFEVQNPLPQQYSISGEPQEHPEAPWN